MWFNSFLEALKMLTWCLHSKLDKMGRNGSTKKTGNRQLLHQERSCTLLQTNKISTSLGILRGIFLVQFRDKLKFSDTLCRYPFYKKNAVEFASFSILQYLTITFFLCFSDEDFLKQLKFGKSLNFLPDSEPHQSISILDDFLFSLHYDCDGISKTKKVERFEWVDLIVASCCLWLLVVARRSQFLARLSVACSSSELETGVSGENMGREPCLSREYGAGRRSPRKKEGRGGEVLENMGRRSWRKHRALFF